MFEFLKEAFERERKTKVKYQDFEKGLGRLEEIVEALEKGDLALEESLSLFEEGMKIAKFCTEKLDSAERRVEILMKSNQGEPLEQAYQESSSD
jgi:exodeoxyribonuclease VII small subunit